jgi:C-methyltransferase C-terminal domain/Methyltransferase domain
MLTLASPCPVCTSLAIVPVVEIPPVPIDTCRMWRSRAGARSARTAPLSLSYCGNCSHVFNRTYNNELPTYEEEYENSQIFSPRFRRYVEEISDNLIASYDLHQKHVVEIGGGRGDFLRIICDRGDNVGVSLGPSYKPEPGDDIPNNVRFIADYYTEKYLDEPADLIVCRHVLEHFSKPRELITTVRKAVGDRNEVVVYFEVPNGNFILREQVCWEFIYQHCSYFTDKSLVTLFAECGFEARNVQERFGDQFLTIEARAVPDDAPPTSAWDERQPTAALCQAIGSAFGARVASWAKYLEQQRVSGRRVIVWGAGAKAVTFLNIVDPAGSAISHVVDVNPRKTGCFIAGSGQEIVEPGAVRELRPEVVVLMNPIYREEIGSALGALCLGPELLVA